jgi:hypothetical protein
MKKNLSVSRVFAPNFSLFRADRSPGREALNGSALLHLKQYPQNQDIVRHHGAPDILPETWPVLPAAALQTKRPFQPGNIGFNAGPKVPQLFVNPQALGPACLWVVQIILHEFQLPAQYLPFQEYSLPFPAPRFGQVAEADLLVNLLHVLGFFPTQNVPDTAPA